MATDVMAEGAAPAAVLPRWRRAGPPWLLTREELLEEIKHEIPIDNLDHQLRQWISEGLVPRPIRQVPRGARSTGQRSLHPYWLVYVIFELWRATQRQATKEELRGVADTAIEKWQAQGDFGLLADRPPETDRIPLYVRQAIWDFAARFSHDPKRPIVQRAFLELEMREGPHTVRLTIDSPEKSMALTGVALSAGSASGTITEAQPLAPEREEWTAWAPRRRFEMDEMLTRDELVDRLKREGVTVTAADLRYWERQGVLPRAIRRRRGQGTYALFPAWYVPLVTWIRAWQGQGLRLREIRPLLRTRAQAMLEDEVREVDVTNLTHRRAIL